MADVLIKRGVSGLPSVSREAPGRYPYESIKVAKLLRSAGLEVGFEDERADRSYLTHDAAEYWLPVLEFAQGFTKDMVVGVLSSLVTVYITKKTGSGEAAEIAAPPPVLHIEVTREGDPTKIVLDGPADVVLEAIANLEGWGDGSVRSQPPEA
ncbi:hypothetical protein [Streptomyces sp. NBC_01233]|uniref:hypothetical protein n=1 Tax=Streptomyces sp. NBC_01233 TaxID=2903787 RepID=UPI002E145F70|nr:hypothetical protein OG332_14570 [Streptomyces sp. NBC_01233]